MSESGAPRVLITRLGHLGECVLTLPLACAIKDQNPQAFIAWAVEEPADRLLAGHSAIDELVIVPRGYLKSPRAVAQLRGKLKSLRCNVALDPEWTAGSSVVALLSAAPRRIGFSTKSGRRWTALLHNDRFQPGSSHFLERTLEILPRLGLQIPEPTFELPSSAESECAVSEFIDASHLGCGYVVLNPGASGWAPRRFARVARHLGEAHRIPSLVTWLDDTEKELVKQLVERSGGHAILGPPPNWSQIAGLLRRSHFYVGGDDPPLHIASAMGIPCIGLYGMTRPQEKGAYGAEHLALQAVDRSNQRRSKRSAVDAIDAERVIAACETIIERHSIRADRQAA